MLRECTHSRRAERSRSEAGSGVAGAGAGASHGAAVSDLQEEQSPGDGRTAGTVAQPCRQT